jgi:hypothetical protein
VHEAGCAATPRALQELECPREVRANVRALRVQHVEALVHELVGVEVRQLRRDVEHERDAARCKHVAVHRVLAVACGIATHHINQPMRHEEIRV